jgi:Tol biopolymer transport system component
MDPHPAQIAHYQIVCKLGEGGMGQVYRARDPRLGRDVAIKVLPAALANDIQYMTRFEREAQTLAALNHPNIAAIYGIEQGAIVMELVEGDTLPCPVPLDTALNYARQIAEGLEMAHEKGIVHRDLKPANIRVTPDGRVKILDFGLAKAIGETTASSSTVSPTLSLSMTQAGVILGTAAYMAPEQARGKAVDKRADIWAFGVVLYEMLTGRMLFGGGETVSDALAAVITRDPDWTALPPDTPPRVRALLARCLRRDPRQRLRDIGDARLILDEPELPALAAPVAPPSRRTWLAWTLAALAILAAAGAIFYRPAPPAAGIGPVRLELPYPPGATPSSSRAVTQLVPSPDGRAIAFIATDPSTSVEHLWVRPLAGGPYRLDKTEGAISPFWSPDSRHLAFFTEYSLKRVPASGGPVQTVVTFDRSSDVLPTGGDWREDGVIAFAYNLSGPLKRVSAAGGPVETLTRLESDESRHSAPQFLPGNRLLFYARHASDTRGAIVLQDLSSGSRVRVMENLTRAAWTPDFLLFVRERALLAQPFDLEAARLTGEARALAEDVTVNEGLGRSNFAVSRNGVVAWRSGNSGLRQIAWYDRKGTRLASVGSPAVIYQISLSPDGKNIGIVGGALGKGDFWIMDAATGVQTRLTNEGQGNPLTTVVWSPDSQRIAVSGATGGIRLFAVATGKPVSSPSGSFLADDWTRDGLSIVCAGPGKDPSLCPVDGSPPRRIERTDRGQYLFRLSPDGRHVAYVQNESGGTEVYVADFPGFSVRRKVSTSGGFFPLWAPTGKEIFYRSLDGGLHVAEFHASPALSVGPPRRLFAFGIGTFGNTYAISPDASRILIADYLTAAEGQAVINLVIDWPDLVR